ncbi:MAG: hypothetical protein BGO51_03960 [Rhodospirillales bacterium 69-11]|nr:sulfite exporter TauE/SafE family protein [Rhodospirillales bacterium]OJW19921.1 MAG: hypothetical protein BGO51_03960 [Rhodospirillales bacterium 69-11]
MDWKLTLSGFLVGGLVGMTGVGGGALMTPLLVLVFGMAPNAAVGTDLLYAAATKSVGTACHGLSKNVDWAIAGRLALGSVPTTAATIFVLNTAQEHGRSSNVTLSTILACALGLTAITLLFQRWILGRGGRERAALNPRLTAWLTVAAGAVLGVIVTLTSVGTGALGMTALVFLYPRSPPSRLVGADVAHAVPLTFLAGLGHWYLGAIDWATLGALLLGSVPGVIGGSQLAIRVPSDVLRVVMAVILLVVAWRLLPL